MKGIESELSLQFPENYTVTQDDDVSHNGFESDYTQTITIEFKEKDIANIVNQIEQSPYYDKLEHLYNNTHSPGENSNTIDTELTHIKDSLRRLNRSGTWIRRSNVYVYMDFFDWKEFCLANFDIEDGTLWFERNHL